MTEPVESYPRLIPRPLTHRIREILDVDLPRDVAWVESCADYTAEVIVETLRPRVFEIAPAEWAEIKANSPHAWRVLVAWRQSQPVPGLR